MRSNCGTNNWRPPPTFAEIQASRTILRSYLRNSSKRLSWRLFEEAHFWCEGLAGVDLTILAVEFDAMLAYGAERQYPAKPSEAEVVT